MSEVLASYLLREQLLKPDQVDDFLQLQVVMGGAFDTNLLEAQVMAEPSLLRAMSEAYRMPPIGKDEIDEIPQKMPDIFPRVFAETYRMIPYRLIGRNLGVLVAERPDETAVMKLEQRLKIRIIPAITSEPRVYYAMQRLYGAEIPPRFQKLLGALDAAPASPPKKNDAPAPVPVETPAAKKTDASAQAPVSAASKMTDASTQAPVQTTSSAPATPEPVFQRERGSVIPDKPEAMDLDTALVRMQLARDRDQIIDVALQFANNAFKFSGFFVLQGNSFVGYSGRGDATSATRMSRVTIPVILQSMFKTVYDTHGHYLGVVPNTGMNQAILDDLGRVMPKICFLAPVGVRGKLTGLIYCDNGKRGVSSKKVADLLVVVTRLGPAFERLIQRKKAEVKVAANVVGDAVKKAAALKALSTGEIPEPKIESVAPPLMETSVELEDETFEAPPKKEEPMSALEFKPDEPTIAITFGDGQTMTPIAATDLLSQRFLNVLKAAEDEEDEDDEEEESIDISDITADALLGKDEPKPHKPTAPPPPQETLQPIATEEDKAARQHRIFAELANETEEEEAKGWEEVLVDTIAQGKQGGHAPATAAEPVEEVGWEDIIVEAAAQVQRDDDKKNRLDDMSVLLEGMDSPDEDVARRATETLWTRREELGDKFGALLGQRFPGRLRVDPFHTASMPPVVELSPVLRLLTALGPQALNIVLPHLESQYPAHRLIATLFFGQVVSGHAFTKLLRRLFDEEPRVREAAADTLRKYARLPGYDDGLQRIRERLQMPMLEAQARACEILGRLRDVKSVPLLIPLAAHKRPEVANTALGALMRITANDRGFEPKAWTEWWVKNSDKPREQWLIDGLHRSEPILRVIADEELRQISGLNFSFDPNGDKKSQEPAIKAWEAWWAHQQKQG